MRLIFIVTFLMMTCLLAFIGFQARQLLAVLICFEGLSLNLMGLLLYSQAMGGSTWMLFSYLTLAICEAALGLSLLTSFARANGSDYVLSSGDLF